MSPIQTNLEGKAEHALFALGSALAQAGYHFVTVTPETHRRVVARRAGTVVPAGAPAERVLRDVFGWSLSFAAGALPPELFDCLGRAGALVTEGDAFRSAVRFSSLGQDLFVHSAYPTVAADSVFFGPDTYRFCAAFERSGLRGDRVVDVGCGSGAGGIAARHRAKQLVLTDINPKALSYARVNAAMAGLVDVAIVLGDLLAPVPAGAIDLVLANPPYMRDDLGRAYRDGGGEHGEDLSLRILREAAMRLSPGGSLFLYTGAAVVDGQDVFLRAAGPLAQDLGLVTRYEEIDPDVFGDELERAGYAAVERIAAVSLIATRPVR